MSDDWQAGGFGIYIHWPFCAAKCPYCDFNSHVSRSIDHGRWRAAYTRELEKAATDLSGRVVRSVFFGGGTPSLMDPATVDQIIRDIRRLWPIANDVEITLEANPTSVEADRFEAFRYGGVNRVSLGVQALNDPDLKKLGRMHSVDEALEALHIARNTFDRVSFDLIYARQHQSLDDWRTELNQALDLETDHLSLYQLTIEDGTAFGDRYSRGKLRGLPSDDLGASLFEVTQEMCEAAGLPAYEVSNHARLGSESRHNQIYWRYGDYLGIGPGAHGRLTINGQRWATEARRNPKDWLNDSDLPSIASKSESLSLADQAIEFLLMGLRLKEGISLERYKKLSGQEIDKSKLDHLVELEMIDIIDGNLSVTNQGFKVLNAVITELFPD